MHIHWVELPVADMERASGFYSALFGLTAQPVDLGTFKMCRFLGQSFSLVSHPAYIPSSYGPLIYLSSPQPLHEIVMRVEPLGGVILRRPVFVSDEFGWMLLFLDTEGNRVALQHD